MLYAAMISTMNDASRLEKFKYGLQLHASNDVRPHMLYGLSEYEGNLMPLVLPPLLFSYYDKLNPMNGQITKEEDRKTIQSLVEGLQKHRIIKEQKYAPSAVGFQGQFNKGLEILDGTGVYTYANGDRFEGTFKDGKKCGEGKMIHFQGDTYIGSYDNDQKVNIHLLTLNIYIYIILLPLFFFLFLILLLLIIKF